MAFSLRLKLRHVANGLRNPRRSFKRVMASCERFLEAFSIGAQRENQHAYSPKHPNGDHQSLVDAEMLYQAIDGQRKAEDTFKTIRSRGGFPIHLGKDRYLFACIRHTGVWSLTGNFNEWSLMSMNQSDSIWWIETTINMIDARYKFSDGEAYAPDPNARRYGYDEYGEHSIVETSEAHLERWFDSGSDEIEPRIIRIWVPKNGEFSRCIFVHDGQNIFNPHAPWGGWKLQDSIPKDILVVAIDNSIQRMNEYTHTTDTVDKTEQGGWGHTYADHLHLNIRPFIEARYGKAEKNALMGASLGGLISLYIALRYPTSYDMAISLSGTVGWGQIEDSMPTIIDLYENAGIQPFSIYIDSGGGGDCNNDANSSKTIINSPDNYSENLIFRDTLNGIGYRSDVSFWYWHEDGAKHNEAAWAARVWRPLSYFSSL